MYYQINQVILCLCIVLFKTDAYKTGVPTGSCMSMEIGHPNTERSDASVQPELYERETGALATCYKPKEEYKWNVTIKSLSNPDKRILGIMVRASAGKFNLERSDPMDKLKYPCPRVVNETIIVGDNYSIVSHRDRLFATKVELGYESSKSTRKNIDFKFAVVFGYKDNMVVDISIPPCVDTPPVTPSPPSTPSPELTDIAPSSTTSSSSSFVDTTSTQTAKKIVSSPVPLFTPQPTVCPNKSPLLRDQCTSDNVVIDKKHDVRKLDIDGVPHECTSLSTLRFFDCSGCEAQFNRQLSCGPEVVEGTRKYECIPLGVEGTKVTKKFRNLSIQKSCICCQL